MIFLGLDFGCWRLSALGFRRAPRPDCPTCTFVRVRGIVGRVTLRGAGKTLRYLKEIEPHKTPANGQPSMQSFSVVELLAQIMPQKKGNSNGTPREHYGRLSTSGPRPSPGNPAARCHCQVTASVRGGSSQSYAHCQTRRHPRTSSLGLSQRDHEVRFRQDGFRDWHGKPAGKSSRARDGFGIRKR